MPWSTPRVCGDAFRGGLLHGLSQGWALTKCVALGNQMGAAKIACAGPQNYTVNASTVIART